MLKTSDQIRAEVKARKLTPTQLSELTGVGYGTCVRLMADGEKAHETTLQKITDFFNKTPMEPAK